MERIETAIASAVRHRHLNALITETFELARAQAADALSRGRTPFPVVLKDCYALKGVHTTCASRMLENFVPSYTATAAERLIQAGGCVIGKGNLDEFCMGTSSALGHFGPVKNAFSDEHNIEHDWIIPGGSSGGAAVAVQTGIADCALGSDTGGSVRNPAAFTGVFGFKPTYGTISRFGLIPLVNSLDGPAIFAQSAEECWNFFTHLCGKDDRDSTSVNLPKRMKLESVKGLKIGIPKEFHNEMLSSEAWQTWNSAANVLHRLGAHIEQVSLPHTKYSLTCYHVASGGDIASNMARYDGVVYGHRAEDERSTFDLYTASRTEALNGIVKKRIHHGNYFLMRRHRAEFFERALKVRRVIAEELWRMFKEVDLLLTPVASQKPSLFSELQAGGFVREECDDFYTQSANMAGVPAVSIPLESQLAVQLIGDRLDDRRVLDVAHLLHSNR